MTTPPTELARPDLARAVARYAERLHTRLGGEHHVVSPLGAWLIVALCSSLSAESGRRHLSEVLGTTPEQAAASAGDLIDAPHPAVGTAAALWVRAALMTPRVKTWQSALPPAMEMGDLPTQGQLDAWAERHTFGLIKQFPLEVGPDVAFLIATALATKVSWEVPFELVDASELGPASAWPARLHRALATPVSANGSGRVPDRRHEQFLAMTDRAGMVAVHIAASREGLSVVSVMAEQQVAPVDVIATAYDIAWRQTTQPRSVERLSLFDLPVGPGPLCEIDEQPAQTSAPDGREERYRSVLPAWSARTTVDLGGEELGFGPAAGGIAAALGLDDYRYEAKQSAFARYSRTGFEAAAVTGLAVALAAFVGRPGARRTATLRFGHPFAAVAVVTGARGGNQRYPAWVGLPVFSAWVVRPEEAVV